MPRDFNNPDLPGWVARLRELVDLCDEAAELGREEFLLRAERAVRDCPAALFPWFGPTHPEAESARLIQAGGEVSFALGLCSQQMSYLVGRSASGHALVTVALPDMEREASFSSQSVALAIVGALLTLTIDSLEGRGVLELARPGPLN